MLKVQENKCSKSQEISFFISYNDIDKGGILMRNIIFLGLISFFMDISSEMVYPIIPLYLTSAFGATPAIDIPVTVIFRGEK